MPPPHHHSPAHSVHMIREKGGTPGKVEYHNNTSNILLHYSTHLNCEPLGVATP